MPPKSPKSKPKAVRKRVRARVAQAASIRDFYDAALANLDNLYWETAGVVLTGGIPKEDYQANVYRLEALKEAGAVLKATLLDGDDEESEDEKERTNGKK